MRTRSAGSMAPNDATRSEEAKGRRRARLLRRPARPARQTRLRGGGCPQRSDRLGHHVSPAAARKAVFVGDLVDRGWPLAGRGHTANLIWQRWQPQNFIGSDTIVKDAVRELCNLRQVRYSSTRHAAPRLPLNPLGASEQTTDTVLCPGGTITDRTLADRFVFAGAATVPKPVTVWW